MAKRKKTKKVYRRRRSISGVKGGDMITGVIGVAAGAVIAQVVGKLAASKVNPKIVNAGQIVLGVMLPKFMKNKFADGIGKGMIAAGSIGILTQFGVLKGIGNIGEVEEYQYEMLSGTDELTAIAGNMDELSNVDDDLTDDTYAMAGYSGELSVLSGMDDEPSHLDFMD